MKKILSGILLYLMISMSLTACATNQQEKEPKETTTVAQTSKPSVATQARSKAATEQTYETVPGDDGQINANDSDAGVLFRVEGALPTEGISVYDAQNIIVETLHPEATFLVPEGYWMVYIYNGMIDVEGVACYGIDFAAENGMEFLIERSFAVSLSGELYEGVPGTGAYAPYELYAAHYNERGSDDMEPISEEEAIWRIENAMASIGAAGDVIQRESQEYINGESCMTFSVGVYSNDGRDYTVTYEFAVSDTGTLWYWDATQSGGWIWFYEP